MNRKLRRLSEAEGKRRQNLPWDRFKNVTISAKERHLSLNPGSTFSPDLVFQNNKYIVQIFLNVKRGFRFYDKAMIRRSDAKPICSWSDLYRIKNEIFGPEVEAVQFFPKVSQLIDDANLYWLWVEVAKNEKN